MNTQAMPLPGDKDKADTRHEFRTRSEISLRAEAVEIVKRKVSRPLTPTEEEDYKIDLANAQIRLHQIQNEFERIKAEFKERMQPFGDEAKKCLNVLAKGAIEDDEQECFLIVNREQRMLEVWTAYGEKIESRKLLPTEYSEYKIDY